MFKQYLGGFRMNNSQVEATNQIITMDDGGKISLNKWEKKGLFKKKPTFIVCISHGMAEHSLRYSEFADFLVTNGAVVYAHDHRGHGKLAEESNSLGFIADEDGFQRVVLDLQAIINHAKTENSGLKTILFGHSFGSFVAQFYIEQFGEDLDACILSGTTGPNAILTKAGELVAKNIKMIKGAHHVSQFLDNMSFGNYCKHIENPASKFDWLSRDAAVVQAYIDDPLCGFICTAGFFADLTHGLNTIHKAENMRKIRKDLPVYFMAGTEDPVGAYSKSVKALVEMYRKLEISRVDAKYYADGRHEMLNEINKAEVYTDITEWIGSILQ